MPIGHSALFVNCIFDVFCEFRAKVTQDNSDSLSESDPASSVLSPKENGMASAVRPVLFISELRSHIHL